MRKLFLLLGVLLVCCGISHSQKLTSISAIVKGYNGKVIDFEFMNQEGINMQFPYQEGQEMSFEVKLNDINLVKVNSYIWLCVRPGDRIHADIQYDGRNYKTAEFTGTPEIIVANQVIRDMRNFRISNDYKMNTLAAIATLVPMEKYYEATKLELEKELAMLEAKKAEIPEDVYRYLYAEHESLLLTNLIKCPEIYAGVRKVKAEAVIYPESYWNILDNYQLHEDVHSLKSRPYMSFLLLYKYYMKKKAAHDQGKEYVQRTGMKEEYEELADFYKGKLRENALFVFLYNQIVAGRDFNELERLVKDFLKKYNEDKYFRKTLTDMMQ